MAAVRNRAVIVLVSTLACAVCAVELSEDLYDLPADECNLPGNSCSQYALQLRGLRHTVPTFDDCKDLPDIHEGAISLVLASNHFFLLMCDIYLESCTQLLAQSFRKQEQIETDKA